MKILKPPQRWRLKYWIIMDVLPRKSDPMVMPSKVLGLFVTTKTWADYLISVKVCFETYQWAVDTSGLLFLFPFALAAITSTPPPILVFILSPSPSSPFSSYRAILVRTERKK